MVRSRTLYMPETLLAAQKGVAAYRYDPSAQFTQAYPGYVPSAETFLYYQVAEIPEQGSWWLPTAASSLQSPSWPTPVVDLETWGPTIPTVLGEEQVVRPLTLFWWIEHLSLPRFPVLPGDRAGGLRGSFPTRVPLSRPSIH